MQTAGDTLHGRSVAPDGARAETLSLGPVLTYGLPQYAASLKLKVLRSVFSVNLPTAAIVITEFSKKF